MSSLVWECKAPGCGRYRGVCTFLQLYSKKRLGRILRKLFSWCRQRKGTAATAQTHLLYLHCRMKGLICRGTSLGYWWKSTAFEEGHRTEETCFFWEPCHMSTYIFPMRRKVSQVVLEIKNLPANAGDARDLGSIPGWGRPLKEEMVTCSHILAWGILAGCSPWGHKEPDLTEHTAQHMGRKTCKVLLCSRMGRMLMKAMSQGRDRALSEAKTVITVRARSPHSPMSLLNQASELRVKQQWDTLGDLQEIDLHGPQCNGKMKIHGGNRH